jgi:hypothetical protein
VLDYLGLVDYVVVLLFVALGGEGVGLGSEGFGNEGLLVVGV